MSGRGIIFTAESVRAILAGRKSQTRRVCKEQPFWTDVSPAWLARCPYGQVGSELWVRESFIVGYENGDGGYSAIPWSGSTPERDGKVFYRATFKEPDPNEHGTMPWGSPIYMPRWASRITLRVTEVRVQRVQEISEEDARAEGVERDTEPCDHSRRSCAQVSCAGPTYRASYWELWDKINGIKAPWKSNPWIYAVSFERMV